MSVYLEALANAAAAGLGLEGLAAIPDGHALLAFERAGELIVQAVPIADLRARVGDTPRMRQLDAPPFHVALLALDLRGGGEVWWLPWAQGGDRFEIGSLLQRAPHRGVA